MISKCSPFCLPYTFRQLLPRTSGAHLARGVTLQRIPLRFVTYGQGLHDETFEGATIPISEDHFHEGCNISVSANTSLLLHGICSPASHLRDMSGREVLPCDLCGTHDSWVPYQAVVSGFVLRRVCGVFFSASVDGSNLYGRCSYWRKLWCMKLSVHTDHSSWSCAIPASANFSGRCAATLISPKTATFAVKSMERRRESHRLWSIRPPRSSGALLPTPPVSSLNANGGWQCRTSEDFSPLLREPQVVPG